MDEEVAATPSEELQNIDAMQEAYKDGIQEALSAVISKMKTAQEKGYELQTVIESISGTFSLWESNILGTEELLESLENN